MNASVTSDCPGRDRLEAVARGEGEGAVEAHLASCDACRRTVAEIRRDNELGARLGRAGSQAPVLRGYKFIREIHRGGQGVVWLAVQEATKREVAVKTLLGRSAADERQRRRFEREIEIVAALNHPNIVKVFDTEVMADGAVACVMERVRGKPLDPARPPATPGPIDQTLKVFLKVCDAVAYAHQKGVIHRDLKPSNILVDSEGEPHVLDFGLAKALSAPSQAAVTYTAEFVGTFAYAAPEQVTGDPDRVDTRTDVYALGVLLYELLTGDRPYPGVGSLTEIIEHIKTTEPAPPSSRRREIDDELETIVLKALAKDRDRRYRSAGGLAEDLRLYADGKPINAKRDSTWYILRKTASRHRASVMVAVVFAVLLAGFGATMVVMYRIAESARDRAETAHGREHRALLVADRERKVVNVLLEEMRRVERAIAAARRPSPPPDQQGRPPGPEGPDDPDRPGPQRQPDGQPRPGPREGGGPRPPPGMKAARQALDDETERLMRDYAGDLEVRAGIMAWITRLSDSPASPGTREMLAHQAVQDFLAAPSLCPSSMDRMAELGRDLAQGGLDVETAEKALTGAIARMDANYGPGSPAAAAALYNLAAVYKEQGKDAEAVRAHDDAIAVLERTTRGEHPVLMDEYTRRAGELAETDPAAAEAFYRKVLETQMRLLSPEHAAVRKARVRLALALVAWSRPAEAEALLREQLAIDEKIYSGSGMRKLLDETRAHLARSLRAQGRESEADAIASSPDSQDK